MSNSKMSILKVRSIYKVLEQALSFTLALRALEYETGRSLTFEVLCENYEFRIAFSK